MVCIAESVVSAAATERIQTTTGWLVNTREWSTEKDSGRSVLDDGLLILQVSFLVDIRDGVHHKRGFSASRGLLAISQICHVGCFERKDKRCFQLSAHMAGGENLSEVFGLPSLLSETRLQGTNSARVAVWGVYRRGMSPNRRHL